MLNIHIYPSLFTHESRILKEAGTLKRRLGFERIELVGVAGSDLAAEERIDEATVIRRIGPSKGAGAAKVLRHLMWCLRVLLHCLRTRPGCVNCHSLPVLPIGVMVKLLTGARLVYDAHELETETTESRGVRKAMSKALERALIGAVDLMIVVSPGIERWYRDQYGITRIVTVLNAPPYQSRIEADDALRASLGIRAEERIVLYQGALAPHRGIEEIARAAPLLRRNGFAVVFMGDGRLGDELRRAAEADGGFFVHPAVNSRILLGYTASADVGLHLIQDTCLNHHFCLPNKIFEYLMAGLPVVASNVPEIRRVIEDARVGVCLGSVKAEDILQAVRSAVAMKTPDLSERLDVVARAHSWEVQEDRLVDAYRAHIL